MLLALVEAGMARDDAYRIVQRAAAAAWDEGASFHDEIAKDPEVIARLDAAAVDALFDPRRFLRQPRPGVFDRLEKLPSRWPGDAASRRARFATSSTPARTACCWSRPTGSARST